MILSYLREMKQFVSFNRRNSALLGIDLGIPQCFVLAPVLFLLYVNDFRAALPCVDPFLFADNTTFISSSFDYAELADCKGSSREMANY